jgi:carbamoyl-phosphate synthase large subunit
MPARTDIQTILVLGSGPIQIGQGCEFDYSGTQACRSLRELGYRVVLLNSNPATIQTDPDSADKVYIEPMTLAYVEQIFEIEKPDAILPTMGGQVALNLFLQVHESGLLTKYGVRTLGVEPETIHFTEDRRRFRDMCAKLGLGVPRGGLARTRTEALRFVEELGFPVVVRASYALGGSGGGIVHSREELDELLHRAFASGANGEMAIEESLIGWKEYELEVMRDSAENFVVVCGIENVNPMGVHTGDSITAAPCMTLTDREYQYLRDSAEKIFRAVGMETGGANIQYAVHPQTGRVIVIEMNPRVSRSSALVSKATGYPIARISAKLAVGCVLTELANEITGNTSASFEPSIDYVAVKIPRFDFEKFKAASPALGVQMKSVGEVLGFGRSFADAFQKAWRSLEQGFDGWPASTLEENELEKALSEPTPHLFLHIKRAMQLGWDVERIHQITFVGRWFLEECFALWRFECELADSEFTQEKAMRAKQLGFSNCTLAKILNTSETAVEAKLAEYSVFPTFKLVDTCAAEFRAKTPYYFKTYEFENENTPIAPGESVVILGSGPNRIGQGIEFDYSCVHAVRAVQMLGKKAILVNCNPETVSTDYNVSDKLFMEALHAEDVLAILREEKPLGVLLQFGGQSALKLACAIDAAGFRILGTPLEVIDLAEDRAQFAAELKEIGLAAPEWKTCTSVDEALMAACHMGYPLLVRPSFVLGGRGMRVVREGAELREYVAAALAVSGGAPVHIDRYLEGALEFDVDLICDGQSCYIPALMEHLEEAGIHSGDSVSVIPPLRASDYSLSEISHASRKLALSMGVIGLFNIQYALHRGKLFVLEANPRSSRSVPFVAKATGVPLAKLGALVALGKTIPEALDAVSFSSEYSAVNSDCSPRKFAVKTPVFPFQKFPECDPFLGAEMRSLGEVMSTGHSVAESVYKGLLSAGFVFTQGNHVLVCGSANLQGTVREALKLLVRRGGFTLLAEQGVAAEIMLQCGVAVRSVRASEFENVCAKLFAEKQVSLVLAPNGFVAPCSVGSAVGRMAVRYRVPFSNSCGAALAFAEAVIYGKRALFEEASARLSVAMANPLGTPVNAEICAMACQSG